AVSARKHTAKRVVLVERPRGELGEPMQDAAAAALGRGRVLLLGGLTGSDVSSDAIVRVAGGSSRVIGRLPTPVHDTAAVRLGRLVYFLGGGPAAGQLYPPLRADPATGATASVGRLPAPSSDQAAAVLDGTAYVIGGYTGTQWLDTIIAWRPGRAATVVAPPHSPLRSAAGTPRRHRALTPRR